TAPPERGDPSADQGGCAPCKAGYKCTKGVPAPCGIGYYSGPGNDSCKNCPKVCETWTTAKIVGLQKSGRLTGHWGAHIRAFFPDEKETPLRSARGLLPPVAVNRLALDDLKACKRGEEEERRHSRTRLRIHERRTILADRGSCSAVRTTTCAGFYCPFEATAEAALYGLRCPPGQYCEEEGTGILPAWVPRPGYARAAQAFRGTLVKAFLRNQLRSRGPQLSPEGLKQLRRLAAEGAAAEFPAGTNSSVSAAFKKLYAAALQGVGQPRPGGRAVLAAAGGGPIPRTPKPCPAGHYCNQSSIEPIPCPPGSYNELEEQGDSGACLPVQEGYYCSAGGCSSRQGNGECAEVSVFLLSPVCPLLLI
ncbi:pan domain-containing protein, partial [Cystoisospora suis]